MWITPKNLPIYRSAQGTEALISDSSKLSDVLEPSVLWRSKPSSSKTWSRRLKRDSSTPRLFTQTLRPSLGNSLVGEWTSSVEASLVSHLVPLECVEETKTQDTSGPTSQMESDDWGDLPLFSSRMLRESSVPNSKETTGAIPKVHLFCSMSLESWKDWVTTRRREYSQRVKSVRHTSVKESLSWVVAPISESQDALLFQGCLSEGESRAWSTPTLGATKALSGGAPNDQAAMYRLQNQVQPTPRQEAQSNTDGNRHESQWATPNTLDHLSQRSEEALIRQATTTRKGRTAPANLREQVNPEAMRIYKQASQWATPTARDCFSPYRGAALVRKDGKSRTDTISTQVTLEWTTPIARDSYEIAMNQPIPDRKDGKSRMDTMPRQVHHQAQYKGKLNPRWVETLMGLPVGWTMPSCATPWIIAPMNSVCWGTELSQPQPQEPSESFGDLWNTPNATQRGDTLRTYLRRSIGRLKRDILPFAPPLQVSVALAELGLSVPLSDLFSSIDLSRGVEEILDDILGEEVD